MPFIYIYVWISFLVFDISQEQKETRGTVAWKDCFHVNHHITALYYIDQTTLWQKYTDCYKLFTVTPAEVGNIPGENATRISLYESVVNATHAAADFCWPSSCQKGFFALRIRWQVFAGDPIAWE